ncbi:EutP/PduV family microcompartment system protein [Thermovenabulum gondwanense]|uniref:Propanediol utilization protein PduV n=1 Tax=Thermovenabulum gondwanense TaxID=520767 RepID=A0A162M5V0_9FIRM|nr:EutP/PduV family microcompartment system protein [Thermovenabulum gondwanense]KYO64139.1 Propanediol utilization protein PduV [Thermovenabulum gondwanense]
MFYEIVKYMLDNNKDKIIVLGPSGAGKSTFISALLGERKNVKKTQMIEFKGRFIDIPGEYIEIRRFNYIVINTALEACLIFVVQDSTSDRPSVPPGFCNIFNIPIYGIINKIDLESSNIERSKKFLIDAGIDEKNIFLVSAKTKEGMYCIEKLIKNHKLLKSFI